MCSRKQPRRGPAGLTERKERLLLPAALRKDSVTYTVTERYKMLGNGLLWSSSVWIQGRKWLGRAAWGLGAVDGDANGINLDPW